MCKRCGNTDQEHMKGKCRDFAAWHLLSQRNDMKIKKKKGNEWWKMIEGESTSVWCRTCAGYAEYKLGTLLSSRCKGQPAKEHDRRHTMYRVTKLEEGCEPTRETADRRPNGPRTVNFSEY